MPEPPTQQSSYPQFIIQAFQSHCSRLDDHQEPLYASSDIKDNPLRVKTYKLTKPDHTKHPKIPTRKTKGAARLLLAQDMGLWIGLRKNYQILKCHDIQ
jgi:hypothetical protein